MDTPTVVKNIKNIQELSTACFYEEIIQSEPIKKKDSLIIIAQGKVRAGFDLKELNEDNITIENDTTFCQMSRFLLVPSILMTLNS